MKFAIISFLFFLCLLNVAYSVNVSVMLSLTTMDSNGNITNPNKLYSDLKQLKAQGVDGVMVDIWWGIVEQQPLYYYWDGYLQLARLVQSLNLTLQVVTSFHSCGDNVGDTCYFPLPRWVLDVGRSNPGIYYTDREGSPDEEYISLGADNLKIFPGNRSPLDMYRDFFASFYDYFQGFMPHVINEVQVGLGPAGELRYPGYQEKKWKYCGVGEFQCYDKYMLASLAKAAAAAGHPEWGNGGPGNAGTYNYNPYYTGFFSDNGGDNYSSGYGRFFLNWYSKVLIQHGEAILQRATSIFASSGIAVAAKISGIHWWYSSNSHSAEATAGYYNTNDQNAYTALANMFARYNVVFDFTCLEMVTYPNDCGSDPESLVKQTRLAANAAGIKYSGENALEVCTPGCDGGKFQQIIKQSSQYGAIQQFTYLRLTDNLISNNYNNFNTFKWFVGQMHNIR